MTLANLALWLKDVTSKHYGMYAIDIGLGT